MCLIIYYIIEVYVCVCWKSARVLFPCGWICFLYSSALVDGFRPGEGISASFFFHDRPAITVHDVEGHAECEVLRQAARDV